MCVCLAEVMSESSYVLGAGAGFKIIRFSLQQPRHGLISKRALQVQDGLCLLTWGTGRRYSTL